MIQAGYDQVETEDEDEDEDDNLHGEILFGSPGDDHNNDDDDIMSQSSFSISKKSIDDLDEYFTHLYSYHRQKGYYPMVIGKLASLFRTFFMVAFSTFFIAYLKWETMYICANQTMCEDELGDHWDQFETYVRPLSLPPFPAFLVTIFVSVFALYWLFDLLHFVFRQYWWIRYMNQVYEYELKIPEHELRVMSWNQVVERYQQIHESGQYQVERRNEPSTAHEIAMRIMRKDNYFVYLVDQEMFRFHVCACCCLNGDRWSVNNAQKEKERKRKKHRKRVRARSSSNDSSSGWLSRCRCCTWSSLAAACGAQFTWTAYLSPFLSRSLRYLITDALIQHKNQFQLDRREFAHAARRLRRNSRWLAVAVFLGMPFILMFQVVSFFLRYAQEFSSSTGGGSGGGGSKRGLHSKFTPYWYVMLCLSLFIYLKLVNNSQWIVTRPGQDDLVPGTRIVKYLFSV